MRWAAAVAALVVTVAIGYSISVLEAEEYLEPMCEGNGHMHDSSPSGPWPTPKKILGFEQQEARNEGLRIFVNPASGEVPFRTHVKWNTEGVSRCEACGAWSGGLALDGNQWVDLYDDMTPLELRCQVTNEDRVVSVSLALRYLPRPETGRPHVEPHAEGG